jgi:hypothetical protein
MNTVSRSHIIITIVAVALIAVLAFTYKTSAPVSKPSGAGIARNVTVSSSVIQEANYGGSKPVITGSGTIVEAANAYIDQTVAAFGAQADKDVPDIRAKFGDVPPAHYEITITATYVESPVTQSLVIETYAYTGGANGMDTFKVFTASREDGALTAITDVIPSSMQDAFVAFVKNKLIAWTNGSDAPVTTKEAVDALTIASFANWAIDGENLVIYFDKYQIGAGALGAVAFPIPLSELQNYFSSAAA